MHRDADARTRSPDQSFDESTTCYQWPYNGDPAQILVKLHTCTAHVLREHGRRRTADLLVGALGGKREVPDAREHDDHAGSDHPANHHSLN